MIGGECPPPGPLDQRTNLSAQGIARAVPEWGARFYLFI